MTGARASQSPIAIETSMTKSITRRAHFGKEAGLLGLKRLFELAELAELAEVRYIAS